MLFLLTTSLYSTEFYYLCGSDEYGCSDYRFCACIPAHDTQANLPYCLDLDNLTCLPLSQTPKCYPLFIYKNQGECLATLFQSEPQPPCQLVPQSTCIDNSIPICNADGNFYSCK